jgi:murein DD-endopeptidase MepM/ murein hydrolase activator NlpD
VIRFCALFLLISGLLVAAVEDGFKPIFNGENLQGWVLVHKTKNSKGYIVEDGKIVCPKDGGGNLLTVDEYANFRLRFEFRIEPGGNSGLGIRAPISGDIAYAGMEIQILDHDHERYAGIKPWQRHGAVYNIQPPHADALKPAGEWNEEEILAIGPRIIVTLNGTVITDADLSTVSDPETIARHPGMFRKKGRIGFLGHGSFIEARNLRIQELPNLENPQVCELAAGETCQVWKADGSTVPVTLNGVNERTEPFFESGNNRFVDAVVSADVDLTVNSVSKQITGGPYRLPAEVNGLHVLLANSGGWQGGIAKDKMAPDKLVRLELQDAALPFYAPKRFVYPIKNYRWRAENFLDTFLGVVFDQDKLYYHRGEDMGHMNDRDPVVALADGRITVYPGPHTDRESNSVRVEDETGLAVRLAHMNSLYLRPELRVGLEVRQGEKLGRTGNTWMGKPTNDPHLHVDATAGEVFRNSYPLLVAAYQNSYPGEIMAVAGGVRHLYAGEEIELDGSLSIPPPGREIANYRWTLTDEASAEGATLSRRYERPGSYTETLQVIDSKGATAYDFVEVFVLDRDVKQRPPYVRINYAPVRGVRAGTPVDFDIRAARLDNVRVDFGDGTIVPWKRTLTHSYSRPGTYFVIVRGADAGSGPGIFRVNVVVEN